MVRLINDKVYFYKGQIVSLDELIARSITPSDINNAYKGTMAYKIISRHNTVPTVKDSLIRLKFDALASHDITYVGIIQSAKASGLKSFPVPYVLTNCHNSLCAVGGTINEDDHMFGLSAAKRYGGIYVPAHQAVIHTYMRERMAAPYKMILGSDSHTRYGAIGTMAIGEGGPELVKQLLSMTYDINYPDVIAVILEGKVQSGVGPQDVALAIIKAVFKNGFVKNKVMEFIGEGIKNLPMEFRNGIDVMTTETTCLSSIWSTDEKSREYLNIHGREEEYSEIAPDELAVYEGAVIVNLNKITPQIAMPFHPSNVYDLQDVIDNPYDVLSEVESEGNKLFGNNAKFSLLDKIENNKIKVQQGIIAGCAGGTYDNIFTASKILKGKYQGNDEFSMSVYPSSQPIYMDLVNKGAIVELIKSGVIIKTAFCGPCFGAGDVPMNNGFSIRHTTRNFESREGSKPSEGQIASVALMDSRSIAATAAAGGILSSAKDIDYDSEIPRFNYDNNIYSNRVYYGYNKPEDSVPLRYAPNIVDWPKIPVLPNNLIIKLAAVINDPITTTDELIPSGETSSYRSNPLKLAEFTLSRKVPEYVDRAKAIKADEEIRRQGTLLKEYKTAIELSKMQLKGDIGISSAIYAVKPGDGSAREQAASCQRVLGGAANIASEYATKRYRSNLINWGMLPLISSGFTFLVNDIIVLPDIDKAIREGKEEIASKLVRDNKVYDITFSTGSLSEEERKIILSGCLMNYYKKLNEVKI